MMFLDNKERVGALLLLAFSLVYLRFALVIPVDPTIGAESFNARTLPVGLASAAIGLSLIQLFLSTRHPEKKRISGTVRGFRWRPMLLLSLSMGVYSLVFEVLGFAIASFLFLQTGFLILGERRFLLSAAVASALVGFLWLILTQAFGLYLDPGELFRLAYGYLS